MPDTARIVLITGVSRGLGRAMAEEFIARGHVIIGCGRSEQAISELRSRHGAPHSFKVVDVRDARSVAEWAAEVAQSPGVPDLLVNNAAVINRSAPLWELTPAEFKEVLDTNVNGVFHLIHAFVPLMIRRGKGVIVNFSSGWGRSTSPEVAPYCATKWAIEGLTQALAQELPGGMAAVPLNPGIIDTAMLRSSFGESASAYPQPLPWAKVAVPFLLGLGPRHNGRPLSVPGTPAE